MTTHPITKKSLFITGLTIILFIGYSPQVPSSARPSQSDTAHEFLTSLLRVNWPEKFKLKEPVNDFLASIEKDMVGFNWLATDNIKGGREMDPYLFAWHFKACGWLGRLLQVLPALAYDMNTDLGSKYKSIVKKVTEIKDNLEKALIVTQAKNRKDQLKKVFSGLKGPNNQLNCRYLGDILGYQMFAKFLIAHDIANTIEFMDFLRSNVQVNNHAKLTEIVFEWIIKALDDPEEVFKAVEATQPVPAIIFFDEAESFLSRDLHSNKSILQDLLEGKAS